MVNDGSPLLLQSLHLLPPNLYQPVNLRHLPAEESENRHLFVGRRQWKSELSKDVCVEVVHRCAHTLQGKRVPDTSLGQHQDCKRWQESLILEPY